MPKRFSFAGLFLIFAGALAGVAAVAAAGPEGPDRPALVAEVRRAELAFAASVEQNRPEQFAGFLDEEAVFVGSQGVTRGKAAIVAAWAVFFGEGRPHFEWRPEIVELSGDGTLGMTRGPWTLRSWQPDGTERVQTGTFNSVWRRQPDGAWKVIFDAGCPPCPACGG